MTGVDRRVLCGCVISLVCLVCLGLPFPKVQGQDLADFERRTTEFILDNGLKFIVCERHETPIVACVTFANVGSVDDPRGQTGLAHLFEHMAFKGTETIGTKDLRKEQSLLVKLDGLFGEITTEEHRPSPDARRLDWLRAAFRETQEQAQQYVVEGELGEALSHAGARGLNATTNFDYTTYYVNLPSNKIELWMSIESERFLMPVLRGFYAEKDVVMEERRLRIDSNPIERFLEDFRGICYRAHPYGTHIVGHMSDIAGLTRTEAEQFFREYYRPGNLTVAIVGDVDVASIKRLSVTYFGRIAPGPQPPPVRTIEPAQLGERSVIVEDASQPAVIVGYHIGNTNHPDRAVLEVITDVLGAGRTSRIYRNLVQGQRIAMSGSAQLLVGKYPGLLVIFAFPAKGKTNAECLQAIHDETSKLQQLPVTGEELQKAKARAKAQVIRSMASNTDLARLLAYNQVLTGDWRTLFGRLGAIDGVTTEDVQRVAGQTFVRRNRCTGMIETTDAHPQEPSK